MASLHVVLSQRLTSDKRGEIVAQIRKMARLNTVQKREVTSDHFPLQQVYFLHSFVFCSAKPQLNGRTVNKVNLEL